MSFGHCFAIFCHFFNFSVYCRGYSILRWNRRPKWNLNQSDRVDTSGKLLFDYENFLEKFSELVSDQIRATMYKVLDVIFFKQWRYDRPFQYWVEHTGLSCIHSNEVQDEGLNLVRSHYLPLKETVVFCFQERNLFILLTKSWMTRNSSSSILAAEEKIMSKCSAHLLSPTVISPKFTQFTAAIWNQVILSLHAAYKDPEIVRQFNRVGHMPRRVFLVSATTEKSFDLSLLSGDSCRLWSRFLHSSANQVSLTNFGVF